MRCTRSHDAGSWQEHAASGLAAGLIPLPGAARAPVRLMRKLRWKKRHGRTGRCVSSCRSQPAAGSTSSRASSASICPRELRPAGVHRKPHRRRRHHRHRHGDQERRLTVIRFLSPTTMSASAPHVLRSEHRLPQGPFAGLSSRPAAPGARRASVADDSELGCGPRRAGQAEARAWAARPPASARTSTCCWRMVRQGRRVSGSSTFRIAAPARRSTI